MKKPTNLFKRAAIAVMAASIVAATPTVASAAWETTGKGWNWIVNGQKATGWQWIDNQWYFMDSTGTMKTGWVQEGGSWYYLAPSGAMATGWTMADGSWYYLKSSGAMATGWVSDNGSWYRMNGSGAMITGWTSWNGGWYYMAPGGDMVTGVIKVDGATYAMDATGKMQTGEVTIAGKTYTFGEDGAAVGEAPEASRTFSGAAETTNTGTGTGGTTAPSKPNRPSYGGGSNSGDNGDNGDNDDNGNQTQKTLDIDNENYSKITNEEKATEYDYVNVTVADGDNFDLSWLKAEEVFISSDMADSATKSRANVPQVKLSNYAKDVMVATATTITADDTLPKVRIITDGVTVPNVTALTIDSPEATDTLVTVTLQGTVENLIVNGGAGGTMITGTGNATTLTTNSPTTVEATTTTVNANVKTIIKANVTTVNAKADVTIDSDKTVDTLNAIRLITIDGAGNIDTVKAGENFITVDGVTVNTINTAASVTVSAGTVTTVNVSEEATGTVEVVVESGATVTNVNNASDATVEISGEGSHPDEATKTATKPVEGEDYTFVTATADAPEAAIKISAVEGGRTLEYISKGGSWDSATPLTADVTTAGTYQIRVKADGTEGQDNCVGPSEPVEVTIKKFTGFATDGVYYADGVKGTANTWVTFEGKEYYLDAAIKKTVNKWVVKTADTVEYYLGSEGTMSVTFTAADCKVTDGKFTTGLTGPNAATAKLYVAGDNTEFVFDDATPNTEYTVKAGVGSERSTLTATFTTPEEAKEALAVPTYEKTDATTIGGSEGTIKITNFDKDATYILLDDQDSDTKKTLETDTFKGLAAGSYKVKVEKEGFESAVTDVITIADGKEDTFPVVEIRQPTQEGETATIKIVTPATLDSETIYELCAWDTTKNELGNVVFTFTESNRIKTDLAIGTYKMRTRKGDQVEVAEVVIEVKVTPSVEENE